MSPEVTQERKSFQYLEVSRSLFAFFSYQVHLVIAGHACERRQPGPETTKRKLTLIRLFLQLPQPMRDLR